MNRFKNILEIVFIISAIFVDIMIIIFFLLDNILEVYELNSNLLLFLVWSSVVSKLTKDET